MRQVMLTVMGLVAWAEASAAADSGRRILSVNRPPYLQLGDAPLRATGPAVAASDQMVIVWQTVEEGEGSPPVDRFAVQAFRFSDGSEATVEQLPPLATGDGTRVTHRARLYELRFNEEYSYRVEHLRGPEGSGPVGVYENRFHTRRPPGRVAAFTFAAYGDSAGLDTSALARFERVSRRVAAAESSFVLLLGDNAYADGTHAELDARLDPRLVPDHVASIARRVEFFGFGNHDVSGPDGHRPALESFFHPSAIRGVSSPVDPPEGEAPGLSYSFDDGLVHVALVDSTAWGGPGERVNSRRQTAIARWLEDDLRASPLPYKIVVAHHPPKAYGGSTGEGMAAELVPAIIRGGGDLLLCGHAHNYQRSFPITGYQQGDVTFRPADADAVREGAHFVQVVAGTGGQAIGGQVPTSPSGWLARAFGGNNGGEVGPLIIDVSREQMRVRYVAAEDGAVKDEFAILRPPPTGADLDGDSDVDQEDFGRFQACMSGPAALYPDERCASADGDGDGDVDEGDLAWFHACLSGSHLPARDECRR